jgi:hypothetical protein
MFTSRRLKGLVLLISLTHRSILIEVFVLHCRAPAPWWLWLPSITKKLVVASG